MENKRVNRKQVAPLIRRRAATPSPRGGRLNLSQEPEINLSRLVVRHSARQAIEGERERFTGFYFSSRGACCCAGESVAAGVVCCASCGAVAAAFAACRAASFAARRCFASSIIFFCSSGETQPPWHLPHSAQLLQPAPQEDLPCFLSLISFTAIAASAANKITEIMIVAGLFRIHCHIKRTSLVYCKYCFCILNGLKKCIFCRHAGGGISFKDRYRFAFIRRSACRDADNDAPHHLASQGASPQGEAAKRRKIETDLSRLTLARHSACGDVNNDTPHRLASQGASPQGEAAKRRRIEADRYRFAFARRSACRDVENDTPHRLASQGASPQGEAAKRRKI